MKLTPEQIAVLTGIKAYKRGGEIHATVELRDDTFRALLADLEEAKQKATTLPDDLHKKISRVLSKHGYPTGVSLPGILDILLNAIHNEIVSKEKFKEMVGRLETELSATRKQLEEAKAQIVTGKKSAARRNANGDR